MEFIFIIFYDSWRTKVKEYALSKNLPIAGLDSLDRIIYFRRATTNRFFLDLNLGQRLHFPSMYLPTRPNEKDMTQGTFFLAEFGSFEFWVFFLLDWMTNQGLRTQSFPLFTHSWSKNNHIHTFLEAICTKWNADNLDQALNSCFRVHFRLYYTLAHPFPM